MQGDSLSPFLFSLYVNDFEMDFIENKCIPVEIRDIIYADDNALFPPRNRKQFTRYVVSLQQYTSKWKIKVNINNTTTVFIKGRIVVGSMAMNS